MVNSEVYGYYNLGEIGRITADANKRIDEIIIQSRMDIIKLTGILEELKAQGLPEETQFWVYGVHMELTMDSRKEAPAEIVSAATALVGRLRKTKANERDSVVYDGTRGDGLKIKFTAVPPGCRVEEREEIIPATEGRVIIKRVLICDGPDGETEEVLE